MRKMLSIALIACFFFTTVPVQAITETIQEELAWQEILNAFEEGERNSFEAPEDEELQETELEEEKSEEEKLEEELLEEELLEEELLEEDRYNEFDIDFAVDETYETNRFIIRYREDSETWQELKSEGLEAVFDESMIVHTRRQGSGRTETRQGRRENLREETRQLRRMAERADAVSVQAIEAENILVLSTYEPMTVEELIETAFWEVDMSEIAFIQPDYAMSPLAADPLLAQQWGHEQVYTPLVSEEQNIADEENTGFLNTIGGVFSRFGRNTESVDSYRMDADVIAAWEQAKGQGVIVALLDSGIEATHEDLASNLLPGWNFIDNNNIVSDPERWYEQGHATMMAGVIAAQANNGIGIAGVAPEAKVLPLKVFQGGAAFTSDIIAAIHYAEERGAQVVNMSFGSRHQNPALYEAIAGSSMLFVCAVGNSGFNIDNHPVYPAAFSLELDNVISVASIDRDGRLSHFSNFGQNTVDVAAPGSEILTTWLHNTYEEGNGTSLAAAYVSGKAALLFSLDRYNTAAEVRERIISSSDTVTGLQDKVRGGRKINAAFAVSNQTAPNRNVIIVDDPPREEIDPGVIPDSEDFELYADGFVSMRRSMSVPRHGLAVVAVNGRIYAIGGHGGGNVVEEYNPQTDTWTRKADMPHARANFAYFVYDNRIYVLGVGGGHPYSTTVDVFDPATNTWTRNGYTPALARGGTATFSPTTGLAYIIGGQYLGGGFIGSHVHAFNPRTFEFTRMPDIRSTPRIGQVTFYHNGHIYIQGGSFLTINLVDSEERYNIHTGITVHGGPSRIPAVNAAGVLTEDRFIGIGGHTADRSPVWTSTIIHSSLAHPSTAYVTKNHMNIARSGMGAALLDGRVYIVGGRNGNYIMPYVEELNLGWHSRSPLLVPLRAFQSVEADGQIYVMGGMRRGGQRSRAVFAYDPIADRWTQRADMPHYFENSAIASAHGNIYVIGGRTAQTGTGAFTNSLMVYEYDPGTDTWTERAPTPRWRAYASATFYNGHIYLLGGWAGGGVLVDRYDPLSDVWVSKNDLPAAKTSPNSDVLHNTLFVKQPWGSSFLLYDENSDTWQTRTPTTNHHGSLYFVIQDVMFSFWRGYGHRTINIYEYYFTENVWARYSTFNFWGHLNEVTVLNNRAYIFTGTDAYSTGFVRYSVARSPWMQRGAIGYAAAGIGAAAMGDTVFAAGGYHQTTFFGQTQYFNHLYVYQNGMWQQRAPMPTARAYFGAAVVNGRFYAIGGQVPERTTITPSATDRVEAYDPVTNTWEVRANLPLRLRNAMVVEANGKIYVIGGRTHGWNTLRTVFEYNPATNTWASRAPMPTGRFGASVGVIDGKIYVAGGFRATSLFRPYNLVDPMNVLEVFDIANNTWETRAPLPHNLGLAGGAARDTFYVIGGTDGFNEFPLVFEYSPVLDRWFTWPGPTGRTYSFGTAMTSEGIFAIAGRNNVGHSSTVEFAPISMLTSDFFHFGDEHINPSGNFSRTFVDMEYSTPGFNMVFSRTYNSGDDRASSISRGWTFGFESRITASGNNSVVRLPNGSGITFAVNVVTGEYTARDSRSTIVRQADGTRVLTTPDQYSYGYNAAGHMIWMQDRNGNRITLDVNVHGHVTAITDPVGRVSTVAYVGGSPGRPGTARISQITDPFGRTVSFAYNSDGRLISVTNPSGFTSSYAYDENGFLSQIGDADDSERASNNARMTISTRTSNNARTIMGVGANNNVTETITYHPRNPGEAFPKVHTITDAFGRTETYVYNPVEGSVTVTDNNGRTRITWFDRMLHPIRERDEEGRETRTAYFTDGGLNWFGEIRSFTDRNGNTTTFERDARGNITRQINPDGSIREFTYDSNNNVISERDEDGRMTFFVYCENNINLVRIARPLNGTDVYSPGVPQGNFVITENTYFTEAEAQAMTGRAIRGLLRSRRDPNGHVTSFTYDANGNVLRTTNALGQVTTHRHNCLGWLIYEISVEGYVTRYYYDREGRVIRKNLHGVATERDIFDNRGNLIQRIMPNQYAAANDPTTFDAHHMSTNANTYNASDHGFRYRYFDNGLLQMQICPIGFVTSFTYDIYGNVLTETLYNGFQNIYTYDVLNRLLTVSFRETSTSPVILTDEFSYHIRPDGRTEVIHSRHLNQTDVAVTRETYDFAGRLIRTDHPDGGHSTNEFAANGTLIRSTDPRGNSTHFAYDGLNRVIGTWSPVGTGVYMYTGFEHDRAGNVIREVRSADTVSALAVPTGNLIWEGFVYDAIGRVIEKTDSMGGRITYTYVDAEHTVIQRVYRSAMDFDQMTNRFNHFGRVRESIRHVNPGDFVSGTSVLRDVFGFDREGNIISHINPNSGNSYDRFFMYDLLGRVHAVHETRVDEHGVARTAVMRFTHDLRGNVLTETDALGRTTRFEYDPRGLLTRVTDAEGGVSVFAYDLAGRVIAEVTPKNHVPGAAIETMSRRTFEYDKADRIVATREIYRDSSGNFRTITNTFTYDLNGNQLTATDGLGHVTRQEFDAADRVISVLDAEAAYRGESFTRTFAYDGAGRLVSETDANNAVTSFTYNGQGRITAVAVDGVTVSSRTYDLAGNMLTETDGNGNTTVFSYNNIGEVRQVILPGDETIDAYTISHQYTNLGDVARSETSMGRVSTFVYDSRRNLLSETVMQSDGTQAISRSFRYDLAHNLRRVTDERGNVTEFTYDNLNRRISETVWVTVNGQLTAQTTTIAYDRNGNATSVTNWLGNTRTNTYDPLNRMIESRDATGNVIQRLIYNDNHMQVASIDALGNTTTFGYDRAGRLISTTDASGNIRRQGFDLVGHQISQTDGRGNVTNFSYDALGRLVKVTNPLGEEMIYTYDDAGNLLTQTDGRGNTSTFVYNARNLMSIRIDAGGLEGGIIDQAKAEFYTFFPDGSLAEKVDRNGVIHVYTYDIHGRRTSDDAGGEIITYTYDNSGNLLVMTDNSGTTTRTYDELGRVTSKTMPLIGRTVFEYDITAGIPAGFVAERTTDPKGNITLRVYDRAGRLHQVRDGNAVVATYTYFANGNRRSVEYANGAITEYTYYANNMLHTLVNRRGMLTIEAYSYTYDANNNLIAKVDRKGTTTYTYDALNRLLTVTEPDGRLTSYTFDASGNRSTETVIYGGETTVTSYSNNPQNRLVATSETVNGIAAGGSRFYYDNNGNMISSTSYSLTSGATSAMDGGIGLFLLGIEGADDDTAIYAYDKRNNLIKAVVGENTTLSKFNGDGLRVERTVNGRTLRYLLKYDRIILEVNAEGAQTARNIFGLNLIQRQADNDTFLYMFNGRGDVTALLNPNGTVAAQYYYDPWGNITEETVRVNNPFRYAGYRWDEESGLYYLNARHYNPVIARFMQEDTFRGCIRDPLSLNFYTYCNNEPIMYFDPTGHSRVLAAVVGAVVTVVANVIRNRSSGGGQSTPVPIFQGLQNAMAQAAVTAFRSMSVGNNAVSGGSAGSSLNIMSSVRKDSNAVGGSPGIDSVPVLNANLIRGSNNDDVRLLQQRLNTLGYRDARGNHLAVDGRFGPNTEFAVNAFKRAEGLLNTGQYAGVVGQTTWTHLFSDRATPSQAIDSMRSAEAMFFIERYQRQWREASVNFHSATTDIGRALAQRTMDAAHARANNIRRLDSMGVDFGVFHEVTLFRQFDTHLCWAYAQVMVEDFHASRSMNQADASARAREIARSVRGDVFYDRPGSPLNSPDTGRRWDAAPFVQSAQDVRDFGALSNHLADGPVYAFYNNNPRDPGVVYRGHFTVITGALSAPGHENLIISNNSWGHVHVQTHADFLSRIPRDDATNPMTFQGILRVNR